MIVDHISGSYRVDINIGDTEYSRIDVERKLKPGVTIRQKEMITIDTPSVFWLATMALFGAIAVCILFVFIGLDIDSV